MNERLTHLYQRYVDNTCTTAEREEFLSILAESDEDETIKDLLDGTWDKISTEKQVFPAAENVLQNILLFHQRTIVKRISWYRYIAAIAAILTLILAGLYFYQRNDDAAQQMVKNSTANIPAGTNKATLTLSNGKVINLDSATNGELAEQGGLTITKTADGQLLYNVSENTAKPSEDKPLYNTIATPRGGQYQVNLPDGTRIWLNAASSLKYPVKFDTNKREVELTGEAYFEVATVMLHTQETKNEAKKMPFIVITDKQQVEVLGTHFNINSYTNENQTKTTLLEGAVKVTALNKHSSSILKPGQQATLNNSGLTTATVDTEEAVAWKNGYFQFNEADLGSIMRQLSRWYDVEVIFEGRSPDDLFHFKVSKNQSLSELLKIFEMNGINLKIEGRKLIVKS